LNQPITLSPFRIEGAISTFNPSTVTSGGGLSLELLSTRKNFLVSQQLK
jgi:hypothetical protein